MNSVGIYKIINKINDKYYVGSSINIKNRWYHHINKLRKNEHHNPHLQSAWNKYGESNFNFIVVEYIHYDLMESDTEFRNRILNIEQNYLNIAFHNKSICYNSRYIPNSSPVLNGERNHFYGKHHTPKTIEFLRFCSTGVKQSVETCKKKSILFSGKNNPRYDSTIYNFYNIKTKEFRNCTRFDLQQEFKLSSGNLSNMIHGTYKSSKNWTIMENK